MNTIEQTQELGTVCAANESRFSASHFSEALTAFSVGWKDPENTEGLLNFIAPAVQVGRRFEYKKSSNAENFFTEADDIRAIGSTFKRIDFSGSSVYSKTLNKGLTIRVDHDDIAGNNWQERYVHMLLQRLYRNELIRVIEALDAHDVESNKVWNATSNPDADLRDTLAAAADETGIYPNRILFGELAWFLRSDAYDSQSTARATRSSGLTTSELAQKLFVDDVRILKARYQASNTVKQRVLGNNLFLFYAQNEITKDEPSNIKRFITPTEDGNPFRVYVEENGKYTDITVEHYSAIAITSPAGIRKLVVTA